MFGRWTVDRLDGAGEDGARRWSAVTAARASFRRGEAPRAAADRGPAAGSSSRAPSGPARSASSWRRWPADRSARSAPTWRRAPSGRWSPSRW